MKERGSVRWANSLKLPAAGWRDLNSGHFTHALVNKSGVLEQMYMLLEKNTLLGHLSMIYLISLNFLSPISHKDNSKRVGDLSEAPDVRAKTPRTSCVLLLRLEQLLVNGQEPGSGVPQTLFSRVPGKRLPLPWGILCFPGLSWQPALSQDKKLLFGQKESMFLLSLDLNKDSHSNNASFCRSSFFRLLWVFFRLRSWLLTTISPTVYVWV